MLRINENKTFELAGTTWTVLDQTEKGFLCIADSICNMQFGKNNNWKESRIREFLNKEFLKKIENEIGEGTLIEFERNLLSLDGLDEYGACTDKVSLINLDEYRKYRKKMTKSYKWCWMITADSTKSNGDDTWVAVVSPSGYVYGDSCYGDGGVRPLCIFPPYIFESGEN